MSERRWFALDQNFPSPVLSTLKDCIPEAELVPIADIDPRMAELDDWQLLHALYADKRSWAGLITNDSAMLTEVEVVSLLIQTNTTLVIAEAAGHDPIRATGLLLTHLPWICEHVDPSRPQLWHLRANHKPHQDPWERMQHLAVRAGMTSAQYYRQHALSPAELKKSPLKRK